MSTVLWFELISVCILASLPHLGDVAILLFYVLHLIEVTGRTIKLP